MAEPTRIVIVGGGFAGYHAARELLRTLPDAAGVEIVLVNRTDYFLYLPLLPEVAAAVIDPRRVTVSLPATLPGIRLALGDVNDVSLDTRTITYTDPEGTERQLGYDRLVLAVGSVNKLLPIPGVAEQAHGFRGVAEALYLRDHVIRQVELAARAETADERAARCTFVVVGAGYTGTEIAAQGPLFTEAIASHHGELRDQKIRWLLLDLAPKVLPELAPRLSRAADRVLRQRGIEVRMETS
ncbi:MAG TPA: FAD-dependent oxidoreductase, partial [Pseudonocardiaceae bacterium]|nr:FAD-dependent oxidoreductase [Pseudonocardiaceae bacterium]